MPKSAIIGYLSAFKKLFDSDLMDFPVLDIREIRYNPQILD